MRKAVASEEPVGKGAEPENTANSQWEHLCED